MFTNILHWICFEAELVSVGWGKKETQFHGSEGKAAATRKFEVENDLFFDLASYAFNDKYNDQCFTSCQ